jgi:hypothetical protein
MDRVRLLLAGALAAAASAQAAPIEAVVLAPGHASGYGGAITVAYRPRVLFGDGTYSGDAANALAAQPRIDGRWRRDGSAFVLEADGGKRQRIEGRLLARPAQPGTTLAGEYRSLSGVGGTAMNVPVVAATKAWRFANDGTLQMAQASGADAGTVVTASGGTAAARYALDGYTIRITGSDGRSEQRLFYFFPDGDRAIGVGAATLSRRR